MTKALNKFIVLLQAFKTAIDAREKYEKAAVKLETQPQNEVALLDANEAMFEYDMACQNAMVELDTYIDKKVDEILHPND